MDPVSLGLGIALFPLLGLAAGVGPGLAPGLHVNNVAVLLLASRPAFEALVVAVFPAAGPDETVAVLSSFVMGTVMGHSFLDFVPSVYLGAPDEKTALGVLPGHRMLLAGEGPPALRPLRLFLGSPVDAYERAKGGIAFVLIGIEVLLILSEKERRVRGRAGRERVVASRARPRAVAGLLFLASGTLGYALLGTPWLTGWNWFPLGPLSDDFGTLVLFPLFTGLFGFGTLALSSRSRAVVPPQDLGAKAGLARRPLARGVLSGSVAGALVSWLPGLSSGAATALAQLLSRGRGDESHPDAQKEFMLALGSVSTAPSVFTVAVLFIIDRARSGAAVAIRALSTGSVPPWEPGSAPPGLLLVLVASAVLAALVAYPVTIRCSRLAARPLPPGRDDLPPRGILALPAGLVL